MARTKPAFANLDERDRIILRALADDAWLTFIQLGALVHLSPSAVQRRVGRMRNQGVITGARAEISVSALDRPVRLYVLITLQEEANAVLASFSRLLAEDGVVIDAHYVAGATDVVLVLQVRDMEEFATFAEKNLNGHPAVKRYKTLTVLRSL